MSLDDHLNRLREDADRQILIPIDLQMILKFAVRLAGVTPVRLTSGHNDVDIMT